MTEIREQVFRMDLPGDWERDESSESGTIAYRETEGKGRVALTLLAVKPSFAIADQRMMLEQYMHHRSRFEKGQSPWLQQTDPLCREQGDEVEGIWGGRDPGTGRKFQHHVSLRGGVLVDLRYEAPAEDEDAFTERFDGIVRSLEVITG
jgi:hypothetical protein